MKRDNKKQTKTTVLLEKYGVIFAFNQDQFDEERKEGVQYTHIGAGALVPTENLDDFTKEFNKL